MHEERQLATRYSLLSMFSYIAVDDWVGLRKSSLALFRLSWDSTVAVEYSIQGIILSYIVACTVCTKDFFFVPILLLLLAIETRPGLLKPKALDKMAVIIWVGQSLPQLSISDTIG